MSNILELIKFDDKGLVPAIIQDRKTKAVLTLCYMSREALEKTLDEGLIYVFRRSKGRLMLKGETSGCTQKVRSLCIDCAGNSILFQVDQKRAACHEGYFTCYFRTMDKIGGVKVVGKRVFDPCKVYKK
jgi:phosphoribosyl-AMP cyclohydrolase